MSRLGQVVDNLLAPMPQRKNRRSRSTSRSSRGSNRSTRSNRRNGKNNNRRQERQRNVTIGGISGVRSAGSFAAAAYSTGQRTREPIISPGNRMTRIVHRELLATVTGSTGFAVFSSLALNPGVSTTFPWLSTQASGWEQYRFNRLAFEFITRCATTAVGSVMLAPDYDALDAPPTTELQATSYRDTTEDVPWKDQACVLDNKAMHPIGPKKYIRTALVANSDLKTYDVGTLHTCTTGQADTVAIGKLWVVYDVELFVPQTGTSSAQLNTDLAVFALSSNQSVTTATATTVVYDTTVVNTMGIVNTSGVFTLPLGNWEITAEATVSGSTAGSNQVFVLEVQKNNASFTPAVQSEQSTSTNGASVGFLSAVATAYATSTGTDTVRVRVTYTSAGTLVANAGMNRILLRLS